MADENTSWWDRLTRRRFYRHRAEIVRPFMPHAILPALGLGLVFLYGLFSFSTSNIQATARTASETALADAGADWARTKTSGQWITIEGNAPSATLAREAELVVRTATDRTPFGWRARPVTRIINRIGIEQVSPDPIPETTATPTAHDWTYSLDRSVLELTGQVPDEATRTAIVNAANLRLDPPRLTAVENKLTVSGNPASAGFGDTALRGVNTLSRCEAGLAKFIDNTFTFSCEAQLGRVPEIKLLAEAPLIFGARGNVEVFSQDAVSTCNAAMMDLLRRARIQFASASSRIATESAPLLADIANAAKTCPGTLRIEGHTDNSGSRNANQRLSRARADAVRTALIDRGIAPDRLEATGLGASQPVGDNSVEAGRALNRRIEIRVANSRN